MTPINYLITDDHAIFRQGLRTVLSDDESLCCIGEAADGLQLLDALRTAQPHVILLDLKMPNMDGIEATRLIRSQYPAIRIIILTMHEDEQLALHLLEAGANGYLIKNADAEEIKLAIRAAHENGYYFSDYVSNLMLRKLVRQGQAAPTFKAQPVFTDKELEVLRLICEGCTAAEIGKRIFLSPRTVEGIRAGLQDKVGVRNAAGLIMYAVKQGIVS